MKHEARRHGLVSIVVAVVVVALVVGVIAFAVTRDTGGADALTVNGQSISQATINQELDGWASSGLPTTSAGGPIKTSDGAVASEFSATWLTNRVGAIAIENLLRKNGVSISAKERSAALKTLPKAFDKVPRSGQEIYLTVALGSNKLGSKLGGNDVTAKAIGREMRKLDVSVDPKYGRWDRARAEVCQASAPCPSASAQSSAGG